MTEFTPNITHYEKGDFSQMLLDDCPTVTGRHVVVEPLLRIGDRKIVGFQWAGKVPYPTARSQWEPNGDDELPHGLDRQGVAAMTDDSTDMDAWIEAQPVFIASQFRPGHTLSETDVTAIQAVLSELSNREETDVEIFHNGRIAGFHEIGGQELADAVQRKSDTFIKNSVRKAMDKMDERAGQPTKVERLYRALVEIANTDDVENMLDPGRNKRLAQHAIAQEAPE